MRLALHASLSARLNATAIWNISQWLGLISCQGTHTGCAAVASSAMTINGLKTPIRAVVIPTLTPVVWWFDASTLSVDRIVRTMSLRAILALVSLAVTVAIGITAGDRMLGATLKTGGATGLRS